MISYNVFFSPKSDVEEECVIRLARTFLEKLKAEQKLRGYRVLRVTNPASFPALPRFQAIVDYDSQEELDASFAFMREPPKVKEGSHGELLELVTDFKVSFTADV
jgi:hypothetical protein